MHVTISLIGRVGFTRRRRDPALGTGRVGNRELLTE